MTSRLQRFIRIARAAQDTLPNQLGQKSWGNQMVGFPNVIMVNPKLLLAITISTGIASYFSVKHEYDKLCFDRLQEIEEKGIKKSGVIIRYRKAFPNLGFLPWLVSYHMSIEIPDKGGNRIRRVGLGGYENAMSCFVRHDKDKYIRTNMDGFTVPVEAYVEFYKLHKHWPENIDIDVLNELTITPEELEDNPKKDLVPFVGRWGSLITIGSKRTILTCRTAVLKVFTDEEKIRRDRMRK